MFMSNESPVPVQPDIASTTLSAKGMPSPSVKERARTRRGRQETSAKKKSAQCQKR
jgi:hypothetical protein